MAKLIFGCGYLGRRVAARWRNDGHAVFAVTRRPQRVGEFQNLGIHPLVGDVTEPATLDAIGQLPDIETVLFAVGYDRSAEDGKSIHDVYVGGLSNVLHRLPDNVQQFLYISSTGVYGQTDGSWVDEDSPCLPTREGGKACLAAEELLAEDALSGRATVLRLAGIYGPQRIPRMQDLAAGRPFQVASEVFLNLIHVEDAAAAVLAAESKAASRVYVVSDGSPVKRRDFYIELARLMNLAPPVFEDPSSDTTSARRAGSNKRIRNARMLRELGVTLKYPSFHAGLRAMVAGDTQKWGS